jgi:hypothetical protein
MFTPFGCVEQCTKNPSRLGATGASLGGIMHLTAHLLLTKLESLGDSDYV